MCAVPSRLLKCYERCRRCGSERLKQSYNAHLTAHVTSKIDVLSHSPGIRRWETGYIWGGSGRCATQTLNIDEEASPRKTREVVRCPNFNNWVARRVSLSRRAITINRIEAEEEG